VIEGTLAGHPGRFLLDSGAALNLVSGRWARGLPQEAVDDLPTHEHLSMANANGENMSSVVKVVLDQPFVAHTFKTLLTFGVSEPMEHDTFDAILGAPFFRAHAVNFNYADGVVYARGRSLGEPLATKLVWYCVWPQRV
jgi:hypothetical protein